MDDTADPYVLLVARAHWKEHGPDAAAVARERAQAFQLLGDMDNASLWQRIAALSSREMQSSDR